MMIIALSATAGTKIKPAKTGSAFFGVDCNAVGRAARIGYYAAGGDSFETAHAIGVAATQACAQRQ